MKRCAIPMPAPPKPVVPNDVEKEKEKGIETGKERVQETNTTIEQNGGDKDMEEILEVHVEHVEGEEDEIRVIEVTRNYGTVPLAFQEEEVEMDWLSIEPEKNCQSQKSIEIAAKQTIREAKLERKCTLLDAKNKQLRMQLKCLKRKLARAKAAKLRYPKKYRTERAINEFLDIQGCKSQMARTLVKLQLKGENVSYTTEERDLAKMIYYNSPATYSKLRKSGCHLPAESSVRRWISGFSNEMFNQIRSNLSILPMEQRLCALKWQEILIKSWEQYVPYLDCVDKQIDLEYLTRNDEKAKNVFLFCVHSINPENNWKQIVAYFLTGTGGMKYEEIIELLKVCLIRLKECGAIVKALTCDKTESNEKVYQELGVTEKNPYFVHEDVTYYATFEPPHSFP